MQVILFQATLIAPSCYTKAQATTQRSKPLHEGPLFADIAAQAKPSKQCLNKCRRGRTIGRTKGVWDPTFFLFLAFIFMFTKPFFYEQVNLLFMIRVILFGLYVFYIGFRMVVVFNVVPGFSIVAHLTTPRKTPTKPHH